MSDMKAGSAWVGEHVEDVKFWLRRIETFLTGIRRLKKLPLLPDALPFWFDLVEWIRFAALAHENPLTLTTNEQNSQNNIDACHAITDSVDLRRPYGDGSIIRVPFVLISG
jgi:hypothetical protein